MELLRRKYRIEQIPRTQQLLYIRTDGRINRAESRDGSRRTAVSRDRAEICAATTVPRQTAA
jgi:hypothetical protein